MRMISHAIMMVRKNIKSYMLLSVTVLISFTVMLVYLIYTDSNIYNKYRGILGSDEEIIITGTSEGQSRELNMFIDQIENIDNTHYYFISELLVDNNIEGQQCEAIVLPKYVWGLFEGEDDENGYLYNTRVDIAGKKEIRLKNDEAIVSKAEYDYLEKTQGEEKYISLTFFEREGFGEFTKKYKVVDKYEIPDGEYRNPIECSVGDPVYISDGYVLEKCASESRHIVIKTDNPEMVLQLIENLGMPRTSAYMHINEAIKEKNIVVKNKYIIAMVLFVLLGVNLYSSFLNALSERKFEIGVKRALGAGKGSIMLQFLTEGLFVMFMNVVVAVISSATIMMAYKYFKYVTDGYVYVIYLSKQSAILYCMFTFFLSLLFSLIFAYKSSCVEVIKYLKEEL